MGLVGEDEYKKYIQNAMSFLSGNDDEIEKILEDNSYS